MSQNPRPDGVNRAEPSPLPEPSGSPVPARPGPSAAGNSHRRRIFLGLLAAGGLGAIGYFAAPWLLNYFTHESTDDAYVNSHVTHVSPRIQGNVAEVLVDDNQLVEPGAVLVRLDAVPYRLAVEQRRAALAQTKLTIDQQVAALRAAEAEVEQARNQVRSQVAGLWGSWYLLQTIQSVVRYQEAALRGNQANEKLQLAKLTLAQKEHERYADLAPRGAASKEMLDQRQAALRVAEEEVTTARESVKQTRALLGAAPGAEDLRELEEVYPGVRYALATAQQTLDQLGVPVQLLAMRTTAIRDNLARLNIAALQEEVPAVKMAKARLEQARAALGGAAFDPYKPYEHPSVVRAQKDLEQAELNLSYTVIQAPIAGFVNRRSVNPGNQVQPGQSLLALRPLQDVWIDANFKETQLDKLCIGQPVDLYVDAYPGRVFHGRVAGFSAGTGASLSLLPPENATGNFVKIVQRLPVRIELSEPVPRETPLFVGLSVTPEVNIQAAPTGPGAGQRLLGRASPKVARR